MAQAPRPKPLRRRRSRLGERLRADFLTGLAVVLPMGLTAMFAWWAFGFLDARVVPLLPGAARFEHLVGFGLVVFVAATTLAGAVTRSYLGRSLLRGVEAQLAGLPVVRSVYLGAKQIVETAVAQGRTAFRRTALVEYPERGTWTLVVVGNAADGELSQRTGVDDLVAIFLPTAPNPITGLLYFVPRRDLILLDMTLEDAAKLVLSAGLVTPPEPAAAERG